MIWLKRIAWGVLALLLVIVMTVAALLYTPAGVKVAVWGAQKALPALSVADSSGSLLRGFTLESVQYDESPIALSVDRLRLEIDDNCLLIPAVCLTELGISDVQFSMPELPPPGAEVPEPPAEPVTEIAMPLPIRVERVVLDDIALDILGNQVTWQHFATAAEMEGSRLVLKPTDWEHIDLTLAPTAPAESSSDAAPAADTAAEPITLPEVVLPLAIDVQRFTVKNFTLQGEAPQQVHLLDLAATAEGSEITIHKLLVDVPQAKLDATAAVTLAADYPLELDAGLDIAMAPLQNHQLQLQAGGSLGALSLDASLKGTIDALVKGSLSPLDPALPFDLEITSQHIQWPIDQDAEFEVADTAVKAAGDLNGFTFTVATAVDGAPMPAVKTALEGQGDLTQVTLKKLVVDTLGGTITGSAKASWKDQVRWQGALDFSHIQPGLEWPEAKGELSGKLRTSGGLTEQGGWFVELPELAVDGLLMEQRLTLDGQLNASDKSGQGNIELLTERLRLQHGPNGLTAKGRLSETWDMTAQVNAPDLSRSLPDAKGRIQGNIALSGKMAEPDIDLQLDANGLAWQELATLEQLSLKGRVTPMPTLKADIRLNASNGVTEGAKLKTLSLAFQGTEAKHQLVLDLDAEPVSAALQLSGKLNREVGWQGVLQQGEIGTEIGPWRLNRPTKLGFGFQNQLVSVAPHCWQQDKSALCLSEAMEAGASGRAKLAVNNFDFTLIAPFMPETVELKGALGANVEATWAPEATPYVKAQVLLPSGSVVKQDDPEAEPMKVGWDRVTLNAELKRNVLRSEWAIAIRDNGDISGRARITELTGEQQLDARVQIDRFTLGFLTPLIQGYDQFDGQVDADLLISGPVMHPAINGLLDISRVKAVGRQVPLDINQANITASFSGYSGTLRGEVLTPDGKLRLQGRGNWQDLAAWQSQLQINGRELRVNVPPMLALKVSPDLTIKAAPKLAEITGVVAIPWGRITVDQLPESAVAVSDDEILLTDDLQPIETEPAIPFTVKTNVRVKIGNNVKLSAFGLKAGLVGELNVRQQDKGPMVYGEVNLRNGTYRSFGQELLIRKGQILFTGPADQPYLAIEAIRNPDSIEDDVTAGIRVSGPADKPKADIFSDPAMPQQNALSYLLRGKDIDAESGDSGSAMTTALISMGLAKSGQLVGDVGKAFGVQDLALDTAGSGDSSQVTISGYIAPGLQVKYGVGIFDSIGEFTVRYRLMQDLYIEAVSGLDSAVDLLYQFEFN
ncbi:autotransporter assembly complex protein TamB [Photobacterium atrarenae]|uniref:Translocation/assembly module TamB n=1 Tax=Photobacterium atrarenae TaxID=865757 RepID=A0ABY5GGH2_9GAMM|nr:translocation/assembly module TamB domain-containing protein [Photobacterium atrarenae]UTV27463.1 translocation/assembly module TamB [Photobacterium atrarenae]